MAKAKKENKGTTPPVKDLTLWYSQLAYFPTDYKEGRLWMAQSLFFSKMNSQRLQDPSKAIVYRKIDRGEVNVQEQKNLIDPPTSKDEGGDARYFSADWKEMPLNAHLDSILSATVRTIPLNITCTLADPVAKLQEQKDKEKIIAQRWVREIINDLLVELGKPKMSDSADPYKYIQNFNSTGDKPKVDEVGDVIDQIKTKIHDDNGLRMFQSLGYKNGLEFAFEIGIKYYLLDQNEYQVKYSQDFFNDIKNFNKVCGRWVVDETTGQGMVMYIDPVELFTSPFKDRNGDDIIYWFHEINVTFAEWERLVGADMDYDTKKKALELQKQQGWQTGANWSNNSNQNSSQVRIGFYSVLTQEANSFSEKYINDKTPVWYNEPLTWEPDADTREEKKVKAYNVWYSCYYMPINIFEYNQNSPIDWAEQSRYIFHIRKDIDMQRYGVDKRYAKSSLISYKNDKQQSWTDIKEAFMTKIRPLWYKFQNCIIQDVQGLALDYDLLGGMLNAVDEANTTEPKGGNKIVDEWKMLRQAGMAWLKFRDKNGNMVVQDPSKLFVPIDSGHMKKGEMYLEAIMNLYNLMTQALAKSQAGEGVQPKARTAVSGTEIAVKAQDKANYFIEEAYIEGVIIPFAQRCAHHIHTICKEKKSFNYAERWKIFNDVVGKFAGAVLEGIEDIDFANIGLTISNEDDSSKKEIVLQSVVQKYAQKGITTAGLGLILFTENVKLQLLELSLEEEKADEKAQKAAAQQQQYIMEQKAADLKTAQALNDSKAEGKNKNIEAQGQIDAQIAKLTGQLKDQGMQLQKQTLLNNKLQENQQKAELKKDDATHKSNIEQQQSLATV